MLLVAAIDGAPGGRPAGEARTLGADAVLDGPADYLAVALDHSASVRAAWERWQAAERQVAVAGGLPEPTLSFAAFVQSVETRVGPQVGKVSLQQTIPWPGRTAAATDAATADARVARQGFEVAVLWVRHQVLDAYWALWLLRANRDVHVSHLAVLDDLSSTVRARVEVGEASLSDLQQVDLARARLAEDIASMEAAEHAAVATLRATLGLRSAEQLPTPLDPPDATLPTEDRSLLVARALAHPVLSQAQARVEGADARLRGRQAERLPGLAVGADWILTAPMTEAGTEQGGQDAVAVGVGLQLPIWQRRYASGISAAEASARAARADARGQADLAVSQLDATLAQVRDQARRVRVTDGTLLPQAEATYAALLGSWAVGEASVAQVLLAEKDLLELRIDGDRARVAHARAWAALDAICGVELPRQSPGEMP